MEKNHLIKIIKNELNNSIWGIKSGFSDTLFFNFGKKIKRKKIINNNKLKFNQDEYTGNSCIHIYCSWRLEFKNKIVLSSIIHEDVIYDFMDVLVGTSIENIEYTTGYDIMITFSNNYKLYTFCTDLDDINWAFVHQNKTMYSIWNNIINESEYEL